jgi:hypothetical protein
MMAEAVQVKKSAAVALFAALGIETASKWAATRMATKLSKVRDLLDEDTKIEDPAVEETLTTVLEALENEAGITVVDDNSKAGKGAAKPAKEKKAPAKEKPPKEPKAPTQSRSYFCGAVIKKHGATKFSKELAEEADKLYNEKTGRSNIRETTYSMRWALQAIAGYNA